MARELLKVHQVDLRAPEITSIVCGYMRAISDLQEATSTTRFNILSAASSDYLHAGRVV